MIFLLNIAKLQEFRRNIVNLQNDVLSCLEEEEEEKDIYYRLDISMHLLSKTNHRPIYV